ncbi:hypothetical protein PAXRUDRAFT_831563 [Paxillus rubicundulus Ve08.2h10]|uniref:Uncharacterized protein n=1 Tax=Paxillus rubicundulus Ve08.2h10 TaxID=930991 RepID=A0A0D0DI25_9AGAM|nr:hypothetical protein PAXRUDRAFT_831563 [Paxillus rubicundulus Ve08.2h10]
MYGLRMHLSVSCILEGSTWSDRSRDLSLALSVSLIASTTTKSFGEVRSLDEGFELRIKSGLGLIMITGRHHPTQLASGEANRSMHRNAFYPFPTAPVGEAIRAQQRANLGRTNSERIFRIDARGR